MNGITVLHILFIGNSLKAPVTEASRE